MTSEASSRFRRAGTVLVALSAVGLAIGFGIAQSTVVTQAEWAVYMAQGLGLDWNMPPNAKSNHYLARLDWTKSVEFEAAQMLEGSTARPTGGGAIRGDASSGPVEALYEVSMLRPGDYGFRVKLAGGGAFLRVSGQSYDLFQPASEPRWVDLDRVALDAGKHPMSLILNGDATAEALGVTPPCMLPVEPVGGWTPLEPLHFEEMAVTLAKALELESDLPELGEALTIRGEEFTRTLVYPFEEEAELDVGAHEPYWLSSGGSIVTAVARFEVAEAGVYSIETRYVSPRPLRWNMDSCLRVVTCPVVPSQVGRRRSLALRLEPGEHELEVTLPPGAKLDRIEVQRRDGSAEEYIRVVEDEGFKMGTPEDLVTRRDALGAARRLRDRFARVVAARCDDALIAMEASAAALRLQSNGPGDGEGPPGQGSIAPPASAGASQTTFADPVFPPVSGQPPGTASPIEP